MPRFFFNLRNREEVPDPEGLILSDAGAARQEAVRAARDIMAEEVRHGRLPLLKQIEVTDENGQPIFAVPFREAIEIEE
jgi:hypothetical protein